MAKLKRAFECKNCGHIQNVWAGQCPDCGKWGTLIEKTIKNERTSSKENPLDFENEARLLKEVKLDESERIKSSFDEFDRAIGGGLVRDSVSILTARPGAGKSTFSRCFCGLEKQCGTIIWNGKTYRPKERLKACYMVMQEVNHQLFTETIQDEVMISMKEENEKEADKFLDMLDLIKVKDRHPMSLSGGQKQRAAIASAIASGRSVLFLDEPTSGLDHKHMLEVAEVLREVWDTGISVYVITHDLELIIECCTDVIHFENGTIADQYQMDAEGMEKIRKYFIQEKCCGKWSKSD